MSAPVVRAVLAALLLTLPLAGCMSQAVLPAVTDAADATDGTIIVGQVRLDPPLADGEQHFGHNVIGTGKLENSVVLLTSEEAVSRDPGPPSFHEAKDAINARLGETFVLKAPPHAFNITGGVIYLELTTDRMDGAYLPGRLRVPISPGDKALYIGTLVFHRNDFFEITRVEIRDEFTAADRLYRKQVTGGPVLRKALLKKIPAH